MKVEIFKQTFEKFNCVSHHEHNPIGGRYLNPLMDLDDLFGDGVIIHKTETPTKRHPLFLIKKTDTDEETYLKNYGNPMCTVTKTHVIVVVERTGDKVAIKLFHGFNAASHIAGLDCLRTRGSSHKSFVCTNDESGMQHTQAADIAGRRLVQRRGCTKNHYTQHLSRTNHS